MKYFSVKGCKSINLSEDNDLHRQTSGKDFVIGKAKIAFSVIILKPGAIGRVKRDYMTMQSHRSSCLKVKKKI